ncbi:SIR2 family protein [Verrucomicrobiales bacterium]|nr:SIR2 family protein [Verrucomicrobiales bacterium]
MKTILFLGSGISLPTNLSGLAELTNAVLHEEWQFSSDGLFYPGRNQNLIEEDPTDSLQRFLKYLTGLADSGHALQGLDRSNYEYLSFIVRPIFDHEHGQSRNAAISPFILEVQSQLSRFPVNQDHTNGYETVLSGMADLASKLIQSVVRHKLMTQNAPVGLELVKELARFADVTIATLNHDLLVETALTEAGISYEDGFGDPDGEIRWFDEGRLDPTNNPRLLKLHGSINWFHMAEKSQNPQTPKYVIPQKADPWHCKTASGEALDNWSGGPLFLTGVGNKPTSYNLGIYAEMLFRFHEALKSAENIVMSGYGWGDSGINVRIVDWFFANNSNQLFLLHEQPESFIEKQTALTHRRDRLKNRSQLIEIRKWMENTSLADLVNQGLSI